MKTCDMCGRYGIGARLRSNGSTLCPYCWNSSGDAPDSYRSSRRSYERKVDNDGDIVPTFFHVRDTWHR